MGTTNTTNLNLIKPDNDEQYNVKHFNDNMDLIDDFAGRVPARALTADKLTTGAKINGVDFDGTKDITLPPTGANTDLSNLTTEGEKHFINKSQITNCLLEVPQRIKYTLVDGTLTIKAGSVVIVPYGTEDKTADLPKGVTFINENFKVYDTQFSDGKFFVWAELQKDYLDSWKEGNGTYFNFLKTALDKDVDFGQSREVDSCFSGSTAPTSKTYMFWFDIQNNIIKRTENGGVIWIDNEGIALPWCANVKNTTGITSIQQVFNGMGYIGSTVWVDKGVKGLCPNGRNEADGSLINEEVVTDKLSLLSIDATVNSSATNLLLNTSKTLEVRITNYDNINNYLTYADGTKAILTTLALLSITAGRVTSFAPKFPFRAADENDVDGMLKMTNNRLLDSYNLAINATRQVDLHSVLPNDGEIYECRFAYQTSTGYNQTAFIYQQTDVELQSSAMWRGRSFSTGAAMQGGGTFIAYVGGQRYINLISTSASSGVCNIVLDLRSYRKVGK